jgi:hypothetical protein
MNMSSPLSHGLETFRKHQLRAGTEKRSLASGKSSRLKRLPRTAQSIISDAARAIKRKQTV